MVFKACRSSASPIATTTEAILQYYEYVNCKLKLYKKILFWYPTKFCTYCCNLPSNEFATFGFLKKTDTLLHFYSVCVCVLVCMKYDTRMMCMKHVVNMYVCMYIKSSPMLSQPPSPLFKQKRKSQWRSIFLDY